MPEHSESDPERFEAHLTPEDAPDLAATYFVPEHRDLGAHQGTMAPWADSSIETLGGLLPTLQDASTFLAERGAPVAATYVDGARMSLSYAMLCVRKVGLTPLKVPAPEEALDIPNAALSEWLGRVDKGYPEQC